MTKHRKSNNETAIQYFDSDSDAEFLDDLNRSFNMSEELRKPYMNIETLDEIKEMIKNLRVLRDM